MGIDFKMNGAWLNEFLLHWFDANIECVLRKTRAMNGYDLCKFKKTIISLL